MSDSFVDNLLNKVNIVDIISKYVKLHKSGANYFGLCPFHNDTHASMSVSNKKKIFKCFSCGVSGNAITFIQKFKKINFGDAIRDVAKFAGYTDSEINGYFNKSNKNYNPILWKFFKINSDANDIFKTLLFNNENKTYLQYLLNRKLSLETIKKFEIGFCGKNNEKKIMYDLLANKDVNSAAQWNEDDLIKASLISMNELNFEITDYFVNRITFPIKDKNGFITSFIARDIKKNTELKYLTSRETKIFSKSSTLYNIDRIYAEKPSTLIILEGNIDLISLYEAGIDENKYGAIALMGVALTYQHIRMIKSLNFVKNIILWFDNDEAGQQSTIANGKKLLESRLNVFVVNNQTKYKDVNDILINCGKDKVLGIIEEKNKLDFLIFYIDKILEKTNSENTTQIINDLLIFIKNYGNELFFTKYCNLIAQKTKLAISDVSNVLNKIKINNFEFKQNIQKKAIIHPFSKNLFSCYLKLLSVLIYDPSLAEIAYYDLDYKTNENSEINDFIYIIKNFVMSSFDNNDILGSEEKMIDKLYLDKKISESTYKIIKNIIVDQKVYYKNSNIVILATKNKTKAIVSHINYYCNELLCMKYKNLLKQEKIDEPTKTMYKDKINKLISKINEFKKHRKTKFHII